MRHKWDWTLKNMNTNCIKACICNAQSVQMCSCTDTKPHANTVYFKLSTCQTAKCGFTQTSWRKVLFIILHLVPLKNTQKHLLLQCWEPGLDGMYSYFESPHCSHRVCHDRVVRHAKWGAHYLLRWGLIGAVKEKGQGQSLAQNILAVCRWSSYWQEMCTEAKKKKVWWIKCFVCLSTGYTKYNTSMRTVVVAINLLSCCHLLGTELIKVCMYKTCTLCSVLCRHETKWKRPLGRLEILSCDIKTLEAY